MFTAIALIIAVSWIAGLFMKSAQPRTFDSMIESQQPQETEYADHVPQIKIVPTTKDKEPKIRTTINV